MYHVAVEGPENRNGLSRRRPSKSAGIGNVGRLSERERAVRVVIATQDEPLSGRRPEEREVSLCRRPVKSTRDDYSVGGEPTVRPSRWPSRNCSCCTTIRRVRDGIFRHGSVVAVAVKIDLTHSGRRARSPKSAVDAERDAVRHGSRDRLADSAVKNRECSAWLRPPPFATTDL